MKKTYYMIGNAHLDPVWMWRWQEGYAEAKATVRSALDRMKEYPDFKFVCSSASIYEWIEESAPEMMEEIRQRVAEGRWIVVGGWYVQPDCNIPSGEGFARQSLYSQRYFKEKLGVTAKTGYCVDSFGHNGMLPQILKKSGMEQYIFMRPGPHEQTLEQDTFVWESPDGSQILAHRLMEPYCHNFKSAEHLQQTLEKHGNNPDDPLPFATIFYGVGNHGGGPTIQNIELVLAHRKEHPETELVFADIGEYFDRIRKEKICLPVRKDDLQHHAAGCYAAVSAIKKANRKGETRLLAAEKFGVMAQNLTAFAYHTDNMKRGWKNIIFNQFHDIMGGCAIEDSYTDSLEMAGEALSIAALAENGALQSVSWAVDTRDAEKGLPIVVFNPHGWDVTAPVVVNKQWDGVTDVNGNAVPHQHVTSQVKYCFDRQDTAFLATVPAYGYTVYWAKTHDTVTESGLTATENRMENECLAVTFDKGLITVTDKKTGRTFVKNGALPVVIDETAHDTWSHVLTYFDREIGTFGTVSAELLESGPVRATVRVTSKWCDSTLIQDFTLYANENKVRVHVTLDWREAHKMCKLAFPSDATEPRAFYQIPYGWIERPCDGEEEPGQMWISVCDSNGGLAVLNNAKYSFSVKGATAYLTACRSPIYGDHGKPRDGHPRYTDQGEQQFDYALMPHCGTDFSAVTREAEVFNTPMPHILENNHKGTLPLTDSFLDLGADNLVATACKSAEDGNGTILRLVETAGKTVKTAVTFFGRKIPVTLTPFEVKTLRIADDVTEVLLTEFEK